MNIYKREYTGAYGGGIILIAAHTAEQADEISKEFLKGCNFPPLFSPAEKLENSRCYNEKAGVILSNFYDGRRKK